jgi:GrpB-like predicted nucleotidyltransferase (UPF0157 family)
MDLDEDVHISEYRGEWARSFAEERSRLSAALGVVAENIEHIGSTAVSGMSAKPIIDIMIGFAELPPTLMTIKKITDQSYEFMGEAGVPGRLYLRRRGADPINLHLVRRGGSHWINNIALRDYLRSSATARERYRQAKVAALADGASTLLAYSEAKSALVRELLDEALARQRGRPNRES